MALKAIVDTLDGVPEGVRDMYTERDGKFHLAVEGMVPKSRLDEFRDSNISLKREKDDILERYKDIDPDQARELILKQQKLRDKTLIDAGKVEELLEQRTAAMRTDFDKQILAVTGERDTMKTQLEGLVVDGALRDAALKAGVTPSAIEDVLLRGRGVYRLEDGKAVPKDGDKVLFGKSGDPMPIEEWVGGLADKAPHLFEPSKGSGSRQAAAGGGRSGTVSRVDQAAFLANLPGIAAGKVQVTA